MKIMFRFAFDESEAERISNAMEVLGANVFSIISHPTQDPIFRTYHNDFIIWAKVKNNDHMIKIMKL